MNSRFKNYGLWTSIASFVMLILQIMGVKFVPDQFSQIVNSFLSILVVAGILNNPTNGAGYHDTVKKDQ